MMMRKLKVHPRVIHECERVGELRYTTYVTASEEWSGGRRAPYVNMRYNGRGI